MRKSKNTMYVYSAHPLSLFGLCPKRPQGVRVDTAYISHCEKRQVFPMAALAVLSRRLEASLWDRNGSKTRVFDAVPRPTAYADYSAARAASSKRLWHICTPIIGIAFSAAIMAPAGRVDPGDA